MYQKKVKREEQLTKNSYKQEEFCDKTGDKMSNHVMVYVSFRKVREPKTHIVSTDDLLLQNLNAHPAKSGLSAMLESASSSSQDMVIDTPAMALLDTLEKYGYKVIGTSSFDESYGGESRGKSYLTWTLKKTSASD